MKRIVLYMVALVILTAQSTLGATQASQEQLDSWTAFNNAHDNLWRIEWDTCGMPSHILGGRVLPEGATPEEMARDFLAELTGVFALQDPENQLELTRVDSSRLGANFVVHVQFREILNFFPVFDSRVKVHISQGISISHASAVACRLDNPVDFTELMLTRDSAITLAVNAVPAGYVETESIMTDSGYVRQDGMNVLAWRVFIYTVDPGHVWRFTINQMGTILEIIDVAWYDTGLANVFFYHPDDGPEQEVSLENLDGSGYLIGTYTDVTNIQFGRAFEPDNDFRYLTVDHHFEDASAYYHIDFAYGQLCELGFVYNGPIGCKVREFDCRPRYRIGRNEIILGKAIYYCKNQAWAADVSVPQQAA